MVHKKCEHGRRKGVCKDCGGSQICEHNRIRSRCKDCGGGSICEHGRIRSSCKDCTGCKHGKRKSECKDCGGGAICEHGIIRYGCRECKGSAICEHNRQRSTCKDCGGGHICEHGRSRHRCKKCKGSGICKHNKCKFRCPECEPKKYLVILQRSRIREIFNKSTLEKTKHTIDYLGCTEQEFYNHITSQLTPEMKEQGFHLDHIKPINKFNLEDEEEINKCCHYSNIQPLLAKDNLSKGIKWTEKEEEEWNNYIIKI